MGLDMYLEAHRYISGYDFANETSRDAYRTILEAAHLHEVADPETPSVTVSTTIGYWRKANAIHAWFVRELADGKDECQDIPVEPEDLMRLRDDVTIALEAYRAGDWKKVAEVLPPVSGFFFGGTEVKTDYYAEDLKLTLKIIDRALKFAAVDADSRSPGAPDGLVAGPFGLFVYRASW